MTLFDLENTVDSPIDDDSTKQELIDRENIEAFTPLILRFCEVFDLEFESLGDDGISVFAGLREIFITPSFLRLRDVDTRELRSVHSSKLEPELFSMLWPRKSLPEGFFETFPPFKFVPR